MNRLYAGLAVAAVLFGAAWLARYRVVGEERSGRQVSVVIFDRWTHRACVVVRDTSAVWWSDCRGGIR